MHGTKIEIFPPIKRISYSERNKISDVSKAKLSFKEQHKNCISCHKNDKCIKCHGDKELVAFDHLRSSGWALKSYHAKLTCQKCHGSKIPFVNIDRNCVSCHKDWNNETFKHSVTGLRLDETHTDMSCEDCHTENNFAVKPVCDGCHEGYAYPKQKPGKLVSK
ncbi:MAG: cytochrome c3 family protein [Ignavibacteriaceae bacterium]|nr:cytochrome c3 family protein [Ignavibacteriaceae bacterium]